ncbi:hypothetical protein IWW50_004021, partial [Coemansia erecta]
MPTLADRYTVDVGFPVACIGLTQTNEVVLGGGGGASRSGVQNKLAAFAIDDTARTLRPTKELVLSSAEDAPTCLAMHPHEKLIACSINASDGEIAAGNNRNCRLFAYTKANIKPGKRTCVLGSTDAADYLKCIAFSASGELVVGGATDGTLSVVGVPKMRPALASIDAGGEINDVGFGARDRWLVAATDAELKVLAVKDASLVRCIDDPHTRAGERAVFRFARFGRGEDSDADMSHILYTVLNTRSRRGAYIVLWSSAEAWARVATRRVSQSPITAFALSRDGTMLAFATAALQIAICDARSLKVLVRVPDAHSFAITALSFDRDDRRLVSASADHTCQVFVLPERWPTPPETALAFITDNTQPIAIVLVLIVAIILAL